MGGQGQEEVGETISGCGPLGGDTVPGEAALEENIMKVDDWTLGA